VTRSPAQCAPQSAPQKCAPQSRTVFKAYPRYLPPIPMRYDYPAYELCLGVIDTAVDTAAGAVANCT
jgi:hypothetical protein